MAWAGPHGPAEKLKAKLTNTTIQKILEIVLISLPPFLISMDYKTDSSTSINILAYLPSRQVSGAAAF
jgi:hypothetical protein